MALHLIPTPIGHPDDWTTRSLNLLKQADLVIVEEFREGSTLLKQIGLQGKKMERLNEHSSAEDVSALADLCESKSVCLISDCGTPNFCDPGFQLIDLCRKRNIPVTSVPGASSLMTLLSLSSERLNSFVFLGFLPADKDERQKKLQEMKSEKRSMVVMDTPYRLNKLIDELSAVIPNRKALLALNLTQESENIIEDKILDIQKKLDKQKAEFLILIY